MPEEKLNDIDIKLLQAFFQFKKLHHINNNQKNFKFKMPDDKYKNLKFSEYTLLFHIKKWTEDNPDGVSASELSSHMNLKPPTINPLLTNLEKVNLIMRKTDPTDRRINRIYLTEEGTQLFKDRKKAICDIFHGLADYLGEEKSNQLVQLMNEVYSYFADSKD